MTCRSPTRDPRTNRRASSTVSSSSSPSIRRSTPTTYGRGIRESPGDLRRPGTHGSGDAGSRLTCTAKSRSSRSTSRSTGRRPRPPTSIRIRADREEAKQHLDLGDDRGAAGRPGRGVEPVLDLAAIVGGQSTLDHGRGGDPASRPRFPVPGPSAPILARSGKVARALPAGPSDSRIPRNGPAGAKSRPGGSDAVDRR